MRQLVIAALHAGHLDGPEGPSHWSVDADEAVEPDADERSMATRWLP